MIDLEEKLSGPGGASQKNWTHLNDTNSELPLDMRFNHGHLVSMVVYSVLMAVSATGNITVLTQLMRRKRAGRASRLDVLLMHLAIADLMRISLELYFGKRVRVRPLRAKVGNERFISVSCTERDVSAQVTFLMMPLEIAWAATVQWLAGDLVCRIMMFTRTFGLYLSSFVLICIAIDRNSFPFCEPFPSIKLLGLRVRRVGIPMASGPANGDWRRPVVFLRRHGPSASRGKGTPSPIITYLVRRPAVSSRWPQGPQPAFSCSCTSHECQHKAKTTLYGLFNHVTRALHAPEGRRAGSIALPPRYVIRPSTLDQSGLSGLSRRQCCESLPRVLCFACVIRKYVPSSFTATYLGRPRYRAASEIGVKTEVRFGFACIPNRYYAILKPLCLTWEARSRRALVVAWVCAVLASLPQSFIFHLGEHPECGSDRLAYFYDCAHLKFIPYLNVTNVVCMRFAGASLTDSTRSAGRYELYLQTRAHADSREFTSRLAPAPAAPDANGPVKLCLSCTARYFQCVSYGSLPTVKHEFAYFLVNMTLMYVAPLVSTLYCSSAALLEIIRRSNTTQVRDGPVGPVRHRTITEYERAVSASAVRFRPVNEMRRSGVGILGRARARTLNMTVTIVIVFFACWSPYYCYCLWYWIDKDSVQKLDPAFQKVLWLFSCTNSCANPIVYGLFNRNRWRWRSNHIGARIAIKSGARTEIESRDSIGIPIGLQFKINNERLDVHAGGAAGISQLLTNDNLVLRKRCRSGSVRRGSRLPYGESMEIPAAALARARGSFADRSAASFRRDIGFVFQDGTHKHINNNTHVNNGLV
ncbi:Gonadotropin-releasing hormone II receptor [Eumeta japonica]|uniref:Gonadotropin-releasing hormone II receptor n=1 Tax=Eumeta variegata TaxID=151549 RepID=A0A4C1X276_EUMVA|nr:Gonadotropin-releasing hormone II receptor [Eumeta japonica]